MSATIKFPMKRVRNLNGQPCFAHAAWPDKRHESDRGPGRATAIAMGNAGSYRQVAPTAAQRAMACE